MLNCITLYIAYTLMLSVYWYYHATRASRYNHVTLLTNPNLTSSWCESRCESVDLVTNANILLNRKCGRSQKPGGKNLWRKIAKTKMWSESFKYTEEIRLKQETSAFSNKVRVINVISGLDITGICCASSGNPNS